MGTWSTESFGNDDALDWFGELRESTSPLSFIQETLNTGSTESVVAASAVLAVMESYGGIEVHADVAAWCAGKAAPPAALKQAAVNAIQAILDDPEADGHDTWAELGEDDADYLSWITMLNSLQAGLR